jgi:hypothetical protein
LNNWVEDFFEIVLKGGPVLLVFRIFPERNVKVKPCLRLREVRRGGFRAFYDCLAVVLFVMQRKPLVLKRLE